MRAEKAGGRISERMSDAQGVQQGETFLSSNSASKTKTKTKNKGGARGDIKEDIVFEIQRFLNDYLSS